MGKIKPAYVTATAEYIFVIDDKGRIWRKSVTGSEWRLKGELPEDPAQ